MMGGLIILRKSNVRRLTNYNESTYWAARSMRTHGMFFAEIDPTLYLSNLNTNDYDYYICLYYTKQFIMPNKERKKTINIVT